MRGSTLIAVAGSATVAVVVGSHLKSFDLGPLQEYAATGVEGALIVVAAADNNWVTNCPSHSLRIPTDVGGGEPGGDASAWPRRQLQESKRWGIQLRRLQQPYRRRWRRRCSHGSWHSDDVGGDCHTCC